MLSDLSPLTSIFHPKPCKKDSRFQKPEAGVARKAEVEEWMDFDPEAVGA